MPDIYYDPYTRTSSGNRYKSLGSGYYQDLTTGQVSKKGPTYGMYGVEDSTEDRYEQEFARKNAFSRSLNAYREQTAQFRDDLLRKFNASTEYNAARGMGAVNRSVAQMGLRANLGDQYGAALSAEAQGRMRQQVMQSNLDFDSKLSQLLAAEELGFIKDEFSFMHRLQAMDYGHQLSKDLARFQHELASNFSWQQAMGDMLETGGTVLGLAL